ncbi:3-isopropylmalate dehydratase small subunit 3 [Camellia lanceoleosa]|uniref:3-isopropylmalate dehydratase small subunit 3 n=1 Tax=Camellia lanceoleosa TaxID=1840588 RepID=A0ACC0GDG3_9ERIC|nr:3-isopropylmalate dehydratase small subunit 3 [Camellia lanceoleosa]
MDPNQFKSKYSIVIAMTTSAGSSPPRRSPGGGVAAVVASPTPDILQNFGGYRRGVINHTSGKEYQMKPIGDARPVIEAGGIFAYARKAGMIPTADDRHHRPQL